MPVTLSDRMATKARTRLWKNLIATEGDVDRSNCREVAGVLKSWIRGTSNEVCAKEFDLIYTWQKLAATLRESVMEGGWLNYMGRSGVVGAGKTT